MKEYLRIPFLANMEKDCENRVNRKNHMQYSENCVHYRENRRPARSVIQLKVY